MGLEGEDSLPSTEGFGVSRSQMGVELCLFLVTLSKTKHPSLPHFPPRDKAGIKTKPSQKMGLQFQQNDTCMLGPTPGTRGRPFLLLLLLGAVIPDISARV